MTSLCGDSLCMSFATFLKDLLAIFSLFHSLVVRHFPVSLQHVTSNKTMSSALGLEKYVTGCNFPF
jgi:succinate-acetate transporter protein